MAPHNDFAELFQDQALDQIPQKEQYFQQQSYNGHHPFKAPHGFPHDYNGNGYDNHHDFSNHHDLNNQNRFDEGPKIPVVFPVEETTLQVVDVEAAVTEAIVTSTEASVTAGASDLGAVIEDALGAISGNATGSATGIGIDVSGGLATEIAESVTEISEIVTEDSQSKFDLATTVKDLFEHDNGEIDSGLQHHFNNAAHNVDYHPHSTDDDEKKYLTLIIILAVMVVLALIALGVYLYKKRQNSGFNQMSGVTVVGKAYDSSRFGENEKKSAQMQGEHSKGASSTQIDERQLQHTEKTPIKGAKN